MEEALMKLSKKLSPNVEPDSDRELVRYVVKAMALEACIEENTALQKCFQQSWYPVCLKEQNEYWNCYRKATIRLRKQYDVY
ncbi:uncharacterized protein [Montipora capricornis]|uniref:uncharacterized protein n=1 Tax=Montipora foliosa TaxID=591990 RepID=UPI0035F1BC54